MSISSKRIRSITLWVLVLIVFFILPGLATAAGLWLYEQGTPDSGMAAAGSNLMKMILVMVLIWEFSMSRSGGPALV